MRKTMLTITLGFAACIAVLPPVASAQAPATPAAAPPMTLWRFLGIPQATSKVNAQLFNRRGNMPGLESKPPLRALSDPANLDPKMPKAIQKAAEIKQAEDLAPQKRKAIKYLAEIGCACYDKDGKVTEALVDAMDDCTEMVRLNSVEAIKAAAGGTPCEQCGNKCCCNEEILKKLAELAYERGPDGCYLEPSARVREAAAEALLVCCTTVEPIEILQEDEPGVPRKEAPPETQPMDDSAPLPPDLQEAAGRSGRSFSLSSFIELGTQPRTEPMVKSTMGAMGMSQSNNGVIVETITDVVPRRGEVTFVNSQDGTARVRFDSVGRVPERTVLRAYHKFLFQTAQVGEYEVVGWNQGEAIIRNVDGRGIGKLSRGDTVTVK